MGLCTGDLIVEINGQNVIETGYYDIISELLGKDFDDYFMIHVNINEDCINNYNARDEDEANLSLVDWCFKHCEDWNDYEGYPAIESIDILAKDPRDTRTAELLNRLPYIFESETRYC